MIKAFLFLFVFLLFLLNPHSQVIASSADDFNAGIEAFNQGYYNKALKLFTKAELGGLDNAQLHYNLGSVHYRLKKYDASKRYFEKLLADPKLAFQSQYSLALIEHKTGNTSKAITLFEKSLELTEEPQLIALVNKQIDTLKGSRSSGTTSKDWFLYVSPGYGYDSNITHTPSSSASNKSDTFLQAILYAETKLYSSGSNSVELSFTHYSKDYRDNNDFNLTTSILNPKYNDQINSWKMTYGLELGRSTFSGEDYLSSTGLSINSRKKLHQNDELRVELKYENISNQSSQFSFIDGNRTALKSEYRSKTRLRETGYLYQFEINDREDTATLNFSPTRHLIGFRYRQSVRDNIKAGFKIDYRDSDYESTPSQNRRDRRSRLSLKSIFRMSSQWTSNLEINFTRNRSSEDSSDYRNKVITVSINGIF